MAKIKILVIEDEEKMADIIQDNLEFEGYDVSLAHTGTEGVEKVLSYNPDLIVLDIILPEKDGIEVCLCLRKQGIETPILFLTAKGSEVDRVLGLEIGADDYMCKPFYMREFLARVKVLLRRTKKNKIEQSIKIANVTIDMERFVVTDRKGKKQELSHYEIEILKLLLENENKPVSRNIILNKVWGVDAFPTDRTVDNYIVKLRKKIEPNPKKPTYIITIHGIGYKLVK